MKKILVPCLLLALMNANTTAYCQLEVLPWGNLRGIRLDDSLVAIESQVVIEHVDGLTERTAHYAQPSDFKRSGNCYEVVTYMKRAELFQEFAASTPGKGCISIRLTAKEATTIKAVQLLLRIQLEGGDRWKILHSGGTLAGSVGQPVADRKVAVGSSTTVGEISILTGNRHYSIRPDWAGRAEFYLEETQVGVQLELALALSGGRVMAAGDRLSGSVELAVIADPSPEAIQVALHADQKGARWEGIGGNFRLQFPETDQAVIDYNLSRLDIRWSRIAMWWSDWDPDEKLSPVHDYPVRDIGPNLAAQIAMANRLVNDGVPLIVSAWFPPQWAILDAPRKPGTYGDLLDPTKTHRQVESIVAYLLMLKERFGIAVDMYSFNEPEIGVRIVQDPQLHVDFMRELAAAIQRAGLSTRILAADTSNATPYARSFAANACADPVLRARIGAIGFHTWGGCEPDNLHQWRELARAHRLPLLVTEGGADSEAHRNPDLFLDERYQFDQARLYLDLCRIAQVASIMEWQLTADYSVLDGGGTYGRQGPLTPTFRFWLLWHLARTPAGYLHSGVDVKQSEAAAAAMVSEDGRGAVIHVLNSGPARGIIISGLPADCSHLVPVVSGIAEGCIEHGPVRVVDGVATFHAPARCLTTFISAEARRD